MAKLSTDELLDAFKEMTLIELSEFVKQFEDTFDVKGAAPVAGAADRVSGHPAGVQEVVEEDCLGGDREDEVRPVDRGPGTDPGQQKECGEDLQYQPGGGLERVRGLGAGVREDHHEQDQRGAV